MLPPVPDGLDLILEADAMISVFAAQRFARIEGFRQDALADARRHGHELTEVIERSVRLEVAAALAITEAAAGALICQADALMNRYPGVWDSLAGARMTSRHATDLVEALDTVEPHLRDALVETGISLAETHPLGTFRRKLRTLIEGVRAVTLPERHAEAAQARRVVVQPAEDGMAWLLLFAPAVEVHAAHGRLTATAKVLAGCAEETRTLDQLRADILGDLLIDGTTDTLPPEARGIRATVVVTVPALTLLDSGDSARGTDNAAQATHAATTAAVAPIVPAAPTARAGPPGPVRVRVRVPAGHPRRAGPPDSGYPGPPGSRVSEGVGPIPIERARELCGGADSWMRVLTHPETGMVLSIGRDRYRPPPELRRLVRWRAETCMAPGCNIPAARCEIDHTIAWEHGGSTDLRNLAPLCKGHHTVKHHGRWTVHQIPDSGGALEWTSPAGRHYRVHPERRVPVFVPSGDAGAPPF